jgi:hypothetical protein
LQSFVRVCAQIKAEANVFESHKEATDWLARQTAREVGLGEWLVKLLVKRV